MLPKIYRMGSTPYWSPWEAKQPTVTCYTLSKSVFLDSCFCLLFLGRARPKRPRHQPPNQPKSGIPTRTQRIGYACIRCQGPNTHTRRSPPPCTPRFHWSPLENTPPKKKKKNRTAGLPPPSGISLNRRHPSQRKHRHRRRPRVSPPANTSDPNCDTNNAAFFFQPHRTVASHQPR